MLTYAAVLLPCFVSLLIAAAMSRQRQQVVALACGVALTVFAALRGYVGTDTFAYHLIFQQRAEENFATVLLGVEPLFAIFIKLVAAFTDSGFAFISFVAVIQGVLLTKLALSSRSPAQFLLLYLGLFYLSLHFNIIRAGIAVLFLIAAVRTPRDGSQPGFYLFVLGAVLSHYSAIIVALPLLAMRQSGVWRKAAASLLVCALAVLVFLYTEFDEVVLRYLAYSDVIAADAADSISLSFLLSLPLYLMLYVSVVSRRNVVGLTALFGAWLVVRWLTSIFSLVGRVEILINCVLLFWILEVSLSGWRYRIRSVGVMALATMWIVGALLGLNREEAVLTNLGVDNAVYLSSPFVPYKFFWDEVQPPS